MLFFFPELNMHSCSQDFSTLYVFGHKHSDSTEECLIFSMFFAVPLKLLFVQTAPHNAFLKPEVGDTLSLSESTGVISGLQLYHVRLYWLILTPIIYLQFCCYPLSSGYPHLFPIALRLTFCSCFA